MTYWEARSACNTTGGTLTSVLDQDEQNFLISKSELLTLIIWQFYVFAHLVQILQQRFCSMHTCSIVIKTTLVDLI